MRLFQVIILFLLVSLPFVAAMTGTSGIHELTF